MLSVLITSSTHAPCPCCLREEGKLVKQWSQLFTYQLISMRSCTLFVKITVRVLTRLISVMQSDLLVHHAQQKVLNASIGQKPMNQEAKRCEIKSKLFRPS